MTIDKTAIRNAATVIVIRDRMTSPSILMGQRGAKAVFMPNKFVFPGGAVDADDANIPLAAGLPAQCAARIADAIDGPLSHAIPVAAIRELWEETGLILGTRGAWERKPPRIGKHLPQRDTSPMQARYNSFSVPSPHQGGHGALTPAFSWWTRMPLPATLITSTPLVTSFRIFSGCP